MVPISVPFWCPVPGWSGGDMESQNLVPCRAKWGWGVLRNLKLCAMCRNYLFVILTLGNVFTLPKWLMSLTPEDAKGDRESHVRHVRLLRASHSQGPY